MITKIDLPARLAAIYRRHGRRSRIIELPPDPAAAQQAKEQARQEWPGETLIFVPARVESEV